MAKKKARQARRAAAAAAAAMLSAAGRCYLNADRLALGEQQLRQSVCPGCRWGYAELRRRRRLAGLEGSGDAALADWLGWLAGLAGLCGECRGDLQAEWGAGVEAECGVRLGWHSRRWGEMESGVVSVVGMQGYRQTGADGRRGLPLVVRQAW